MSARKFKASWWVDFRCEKVRYRKRSPVNTRAGAIEYEMTLRGRLARGEPVEPTVQVVPRFHEFADRWLALYQSSNHRPSTVESRRGSLALYLLPAFGDLRLTEITTARLEQFKALLTSKGLAPKTINNHLSALHTCLQAALEWGELDKLPRVHWLKLPPIRDNYLTPRECEDLLAGASSPTWRAMILCALRTGMRLGELLGLHWSDIDFERRIITVQHSAAKGGLIGAPKTNRRRHIPIAADLLTYFVATRNSRGLVFREFGDAPMSSASASRYIHLACQRGGVRRIGWHVLRHTFASHLVSRGVPIRTVQILLGHTTVMMTERYAHLAPSALHDAITVLTAADNVVEYHSTHPRPAQLVDI